MILVNPKNDTFDHLDRQSNELILKTISFFEKKGKSKLKKDDHDRVWYSDFLNFVKKENLFATFLTPPEYGDKGARWDTYRNCQLNEILGFYGLSYWYTWQVTILGLGPIWMSTNDEVKKKTAQLLKQGAIFAYGLSEKEHGADIYASSMTVEKNGKGTFKANGSKYYIGNGNKAALVSTFAKMADTDEYVFFVAESSNKKYTCVKNIVNSQNYVAEFQLNDYPLSSKEILSMGHEAWDACLNTVNIGKYNLGWASIGLCTHSFYEALNHASHRRLFNTYVTDFTHIRHMFVDAYTRLVAMKIFALRASDYIRVATANDRRYLLYTPMVKMKVTTQGEEVMNLLWDIIAAKGFEKDMFFEMAVRDIRALPKLEGTVHVNMALIIKFMPNYFFRPAKYDYVAKQDGQQHDDFLFRQGETRGLSKIRFHDYKAVYSDCSLPNVKIFRKQIRQLKMLLFLARPDKKQIKDFDFLLILGELFTLVVYGQLILENAKIFQTPDDLVDQIFDFMVRDFSKYALQLYLKTSSTARQKTLCRRMIRKPDINNQRFERVLNEHLYILKDTYEMNR